MKHNEHGQGALELVLVLPLMVLLFAVLMVFGRLVYVQIALDAAAHDAARTAIESLDAGRGPYQAHLAARWTLQGFNLKPEAATIQILAPQQWARGEAVEVRVSYRPSMRDVLGVGWLFEYAPRTLTGRAVLKVEEHKSRWAWTE